MTLVDYQYNSVTVLFLNISKYQITLEIEKTFYLDQTVYRNLNWLIGHHGESHQVRIIQQEKVLQEIKQNNHILKIHSKSKQVLKNASVTNKQNSSTLCSEIYICIYIYINVLPFL